MKMKKMLNTNYINNSNRYRATNVWSFLLLTYLNSAKVSRSSYQKTCFFSGFYLVSRLFVETAVILLSKLFSICPLKTMDSQFSFSFARVQFSLDNSQKQN